jgi:light-regulated signal transduction histidine kinase (bacteriophytochrome)
VEEEVRELNEDLTRRATELETANKELQAFGYSVSHDLRAPLIGIQGLSRILLEKYAGQLDAKGQHVLSVIQRDTQKMSQLIDNLIALSRFEHQEVKPSDIDMEEIANAVFEELRNISPDIPEDSLQLKLQPLPPSYGDPAMIRQVFFNLLSNAIKFSRPKQVGVVELGCMTGEDQNTYYVKDNGVGFDMQYASKCSLGLPAAHSSHEFQGTGIGLAIVERIIHRQGGKVWAEAEVGKGATFYFTLPKGQSTMQQKG